MTTGESTATARNQGSLTSLQLGLQKLASYGGCGCGCPGQEGRVAIRVRRCARLGCGMAAAGGALPGRSGGFGVWKWWGAVLVVVGRVGKPPACQAGHGRQIIREVKDIFWFDVASLFLVICFPRFWFVMYFWCFLFGRAADRGIVVSRCLVVNL